MRFSLRHLPLLLLAIDPVLSELAPFSDVPSGSLELWRRAPPAQSGNEPRRQGSLSGSEDPLSSDEGSFSGNEADDDEPSFNVDEGPAPSGDDQLIQGTSRMTLGDLGGEQVPAMNERPAEGYSGVLAEQRGNNPRSIREQRYVRSLSA